LDFQGTCYIYCAVPVIGFTYLNQSQVDVWLSCMNPSCNEFSNCKDFIDSNDCFNKIININDGTFYGVSMSAFEYVHHYQGIQMSGLSTDNPIILAPSTPQEKDQQKQQLFTSNISILLGIWIPVFIVCVVLLIIALRFSRRDLNTQNVIVS
jgi:hypothetical protein